MRTTITVDNDIFEAAQARNWRGADCAPRRTRPAKTACRFSKSRAMRQSFPAAARRRCSTRTRREAAVARHKCAAGTGVAESSASRQGARLVCRARQTRLGDMRVHAVGICPAFVQPGLFARCGFAAGRRRVAAAMDAAQGAPFLEFARRGFACDLSARLGTSTGQRRLARRSRAEKQRPAGHAGHASVGARAGRKFGRDHRFVMPAYE